LPTSKGGTSTTAKNSYELSEDKEFIWIIPYRSVCSFQYFPLVNSNLNFSYKLTFISTDLPIIVNKLPIQSIKHSSTISSELI